MTIWHDAIASEMAWDPLLGRLNHHGFPDQDMVTVRYLEMLYLSLTPSPRPRPGERVLEVSGRSAGGSR